MTEGCWTEGGFGSGIRRALERVAYDNRLVSPVLIGRSVFRQISIPEPPVEEFEHQGPALQRQRRVVTWAFVA